jgi:putative RecB family exonuclease
LSFKRCRSQYGFFRIRGYESATATQLYFGTLAHDVLDQIHRNYVSGIPLPDDTQLENLVLQAHDRLVRAGIRAYNAPFQRALVTKLLSRFLEAFGEAFYRHVKQTEYKLEQRMLLDPNQQTEYILEGVVDVLTGAVCHELGIMNIATNNDDIEIWDYKSGRKPTQGSKQLQDYIYQMRVYAELYRRQSGRLPDRCVLVFLGELGDDATWVNNRERLLRDSVFFVDPIERRIDEAIADFNRTVEQIELIRAQPYNLQWQPPPSNEEIDEDTCAACDLRYGCSYFTANHDRDQSQRREAL